MLDNASIYRPHAKAVLTTGETYYGPVWADGNKLFILFGNVKRYVEIGYHWHNWKEIR